jgi:hypothetical protein
MCQVKQHIVGTGELIFGHDIYIQPLFYELVAFLKKWA